MIRIHLDLPPQEYRRLAAAADAKGMQIGPYLYALASLNVEAVAKANRPRRPRGRPRASFTPWQRTIFDELYGMGRTDAEIAPVLKMSAYQVKTRRETLGLPTNQLSRRTA